MMKQTTVLVLALTLSTVAFANAKKAKETRLSEISLEGKKATAQTGAVVATSKTQAVAQKAAKEIGFGAEARELDTMMNAVKDKDGNLVMITVVENVATSKGKENEKFLLAHAGRLRGTDADATLDNPGVKKVMTNLDKIQEVFGERGPVLVAEMRRTIESGEAKTMGEALRLGLNKSKGRKLSKAEADKVVRKDLVECK